MTTIINTPNQPPVEKTTLVGVTDNSGWAIAVVILIAVIAFGGYYYMKHRAPAQNTSGGTNINVTLPETTQNPPQGSESQ